MWRDGGFRKQTGENAEGFLAIARKSVECRDHQREKEGEGEREGDKERKRASRTSKITTAEEEDARGQNSVVPGEGGDRRRRLSSAALRCFRFSESSVFRHPRNPRAPTYISVKVGAAFPSDRSFFSLSLYRSLFSSPLYLVMDGFGHGERRTGKNKRGAELTENTRRWRC